MRDFFEILNAKMNQMVGDASDPKWKIDKSILAHSQNPQLVGPLLYAYTTKSKYNEWYKNDFLLEMVSYILSEAMKNKSYGGYRRLLPIFAESYPAIAKLLPKLKSKYEKFLFAFASYFAHELINRKDIRQLTSANVGYGTNHLAVELKGLVQYVKYCSKSVGQLKGINKEFLKKYLKIFMAYMHPDGFWPECDGPALNYNTLTGVSLMGAIDELGQMEQYYQQILKVAEFHTSVTLPNGRYIDILDGRNCGCHYSGRGAFLALSPEGNSLYSKMISRIRSNNDLVQIGEPLALLLFDEKMKSKYGNEKSREFWSKKNIIIKLKDFLIVKHDTWIAGASNIKFRPRPEGHFNLDFQNLFSLYHTEFGEIFGGQNSKNDPEIGTFSKFMNKFDGYPVKTPMPKYIPGNGEINYEKNQLHIRRDYRGFEGDLSINFKSSNALELLVRAYARADEYPIQFNLILPCNTKNILKDEHRKPVKFSEKMKDLTALNTGKYIYIDQKEGDLKNKGRRLKISLPEGAFVKWPYKPWDTYNLQTDRELLPQNWYFVLVVNVSSALTRIKIEIV